MQVFFGKYCVFFKFFLFFSQNIAKNLLGIIFFQLHILFSEKYLCRFARRNGDFYAEKI